MKRTYPDYSKLRLREDIYEKLPESNKKILDNFLIHCEGSAGPSSVRKIFHKVVQIADIFEKDLNKIDIKDIDVFLSILNKSNRGTDTKNDTKKILKRFLKWKYKNWSSKFNGLDFQGIKQKRKPKSERLAKNDLLTKEDIEKLLRASKETRYKALIILMYETASRPEELYKLRWKDVDFANNEIHFSSSKTGDVRTLPIAESVNRLNLYKDEYPYENLRAEDFVFPGVSRDIQITTQKVHHYLQRLGRKILDKRVFPYVFRHSRLQYLRKKLSPDSYQMFAGHSMEVALEHYSHMDSDDLRKEMNERIFNIEEVTKKENERIAKLEKEMKELLKYYQDMTNYFADAFQDDYFKNRLKETSKKYGKLINS